jgi:hypothetical protein
MKKKGNKAKQPADSPKSTTDAPKDPPSCTFIGASATGIGLEQARGRQICLHGWTSFGAGDDEATSITIQVWDGKIWEVLEVIGPAGHDVTQAQRLDPKIFQGKYKGERVLTVFKPAEKSDN